MSLLITYIYKKPEKSEGAVPSSCCISHQRCELLKPKYAMQYGCSICTHLCIMGLTVHSFQNF